MGAVQIPDDQNAPLLEGYKVIDPNYDKDRQDPAEPVPSGAQGRGDRELPQAPFDNDNQEEYKYRMDPNNPLSYEENQKQLEQLEDGDEVPPHLSTKP